MKSGVLWHGSTNWNAPLWFLLSLFFVKLSYIYIGRFNSYVVIVILLVLALLHNWYLADKGFWWIGNYCSGMIFFILGSKLKDLQYDKYALLISFIIVISIGIHKPTFVTMFGNYDIYGDGAYLLWYPFCLAGIIIFNNFMLFASKIFRFYNFETVGRYSIGFYVIHYPLGLLICNIYKLRHSSINEFELLFYLCLVWLLFIPLLVFFFNTNKFSKFIGKASYEK